MNLLFLFPEVWTGTSAREVRTLATCVALAASGVEVTLVIAGAEERLREQLLDLTGVDDLAGLSLVELSRTLGPLQSTSIFTRNFLHWMKAPHAFDLAYISQPKAGPILTQARLPYVYEAQRIFTQGQSNPTRQRALHKLEGQVLDAATRCIATSTALASALNTWFGLSKAFSILPGAGMPPLDEGISAPDGPFVYCGSIDERTDLGGILHAAQETNLPLKIVGGTEEEWRAVGQHYDTSGVEWLPQVPLSHVAEALHGARAGLVPTNPDSPSGEFACPLKLFDYARCGLPVVSTGLHALQDLQVGDWCTQIWITQIAGPARAAWTDALRNFKYDAAKGEAARLWAAENTWFERAEQLKAMLER